MHLNVLTMMPINFIYYCKNVFIYMNIWLSEKNSMSILTEKEHFNSHLHMENITDADYKHAKECSFQNTKFRKISENFQNICFRIYELDPTCFLTALD